MSINKEHLVVFFVFAAFLAAPFFCSAQQYNLEKIFYLAKYNAVKGVEDVNKNYKEIDILAPQYYVVNANLAVSGNFGPKLKKAIKDHNLKVMPLVANAGFSQATIHNLLISPLAQDNVINALIGIAKSQKFIGWQFDFEHINYLDKDLYSAFVQKAYPLFKENNLIFSVAVAPRSVDYEDTDAFKNWDGAYDYQKIADSTDFVSLMTYDDSNSVGPTASIPFVNKVLDYIKGKIPAQKLSLGVPLYSWKWSVKDNKNIGQGSYAGALSVMENFRYNWGFDPDLGVSWLTYFFKNKEYKIWFENKQSFQDKLSITTQNNLRGFSAWLLGGEDPAIWGVLGKSLK
ncbi:MAG: glycosyl hydrolase family 18 protein [Candidatus Staskawiczbacteria bacterium]|jgi:spore germination protein YaaH